MKPQVSFRVGSTTGLGSEDAGEEARPDRVTEFGIVDFPALASRRPAAQDHQMGSLLILRAVINDRLVRGSASTFLWDGSARLRTGLNSYSVRSR